MSAESLYMPTYIHLRNYSVYSLSEGAIKISQLTGFAKANKMPAIALTDRNNMFGALEFSLKAAGDGIQPILGVTLHVEDDLDAAFSGSKTRGELVLLAQNQQGYMNLLKIVSAAYLEADPTDAPLITLSALKPFTDGLIALTAGVDGLVGQYLLANQKDKALETLLWLKDLFTGRLYIEISRHGLASEEDTEPLFLKMAYDHHIPIVATNHNYFPKAEMYESHDAFLCISQGKYVSQSDRRRITQDHFLKSEADMASLFEDLPEALENSVFIARRCSFLLKGINPLLPKYPTEGGISEAEELKRQSEEGLAKRLEVNGLAPGFTAEDYRERLQFELDVIAQMQFPGYFLIVSDFIKWTKSQGIPVGPGRGSGAGSVVAWALTITDLDPLRFGLLFERFLNPERVSMPDFDIDFCQERRDEVITYVQQRYGRDRVAQIITFGTLQARAALRDVGRVLQIPYGQVDRICKLVPNNPANPVTLEEAVEIEPQLRNEIVADETVKNLVDTAIALEGLYRHASTHAAGVVIGDRPLNELVPLYRDPKSDMPVTQFNMKFVEQAGLVKFDFLGLKTLSVLNEAVRLLKLRDIDLDLLTIPLDDVKTFQLLSRGDATGVFQLESSGMRDVLKKLKPVRFEEIIALVALYRPGPMDNIPKYIAVKNGKEEPDYLHPSLEPVLKETFGIMIYQEQVMEIARILAGYSLGSADLLRRAMGKKIKEEMDAQRKSFVDGSVQNKVPAEQAGLIFDQVAKFAGYGFNKSHAAAYALIAYQTAYMKANYPVEFMAALMTFDLNNTDKLSLFRQELQRLNVPLLMPDVQKSLPTFAVEKIDDHYGIRYALGAIKSVGVSAMQILVNDRDANGPFKDVFEFVERFDTKVINKRNLEHLICAGALDSFGIERSILYENIERLIRMASTAANDRSTGQHGLFGDEISTQSSQQLVATAKWDNLTELRHEFEAVGFYLSAHPLENYASFLQKERVISYVSLLEKAGTTGSTRFHLAGIITQKQIRTSKKGSRFAFIQLSDATGVYEITMFSEMLMQTRDILEVGKSVVVSVDASFEGDDVRLICQDMKPLDQLIAERGKGIVIAVETVKAAEQLISILKKQPGGDGKCVFHFQIEVDDENEADILWKSDIILTPEMKRDIGSLPGLQIMKEF